MQRKEIKINFGDVVLYVKLIWMYLTAMFTAIFIYPVLHEMGHFLAALLVDADVVEMSVFPLPHVSVLVDSKNSWGQAAIGMGGLLFPMLCTAYRPRRFSSYIVVGTIVFINFLSWLVSCAALLANCLGFCWESEDVIIVMQSLKGAEAEVSFFCLALLVLSFYILSKKVDVCRILSFF